MKFAIVIPANVGFDYIAPGQSSSASEVVIAWGFEFGSATPIPITAAGPQPRKGAHVTDINGHWIDL